MYNDERDDLIESVAAELRRPQPLREDFDEQVMSAILERPRASVFAGLLEWLVQPRAIRLSPLSAFAGAVVVLVALFATWEIAQRDVTVHLPDLVEGTTAPEGMQVVQFVFVAPRASTVSLVGDFNGWDTDATPMQRKAAPGVWTVSLTLPVGRHQYAFVVDQQRWAADPAAPPSVSDDFGTPSSVVTVTAGSDA